MLTRRLFSVLFAALVMAVGVIASPIAGVQAGAPGTGGIFVVVNECPPGTDPDDVSGCNVNYAVLTPDAFTVTTPDGGTLTMADAHFGDGGFDWSGLAFGTYQVSQSSLHPKYNTYLIPGFDLDATTGAYLVTLTAEAPSAVLTVYNFQPTTEPVDTDGDALSDSLEVDLGTDPNDPDTDNDGANDGVEYDAGTDPLDPNDFPAAVGDSSLIVYAATCPVAYSGNDFFGDCDPTANITFGIGFAASEFFADAVTDANGNAVFADLTNGTYVLAADLPGDAIDDIEIFCGVPGATEPRAIERNSLTSITFDLLSGEDLTCTYYIIPADAGQPAPTPKPTTGPVVALPNTGTGTMTEQGMNFALVALLVVGGLAVSGTTVVAVRRRG